MIGYRNTRDHPLIPTIIEPHLTAPSPIPSGGTLAKHTIHTQTLLRGSLMDLPRSSSPHRCQQVVILSESVNAAMPRCHEKIETV